MIQCNLSCDAHTFCSIVFNVSPGIDIAPIKPTGSKYCSASLKFFPLTMEAMLSREQQLFFSFVTYNLKPTHMTCIVGKDEELAWNISLEYRRSLSPLLGKLRTFAYLVPTKFRQSFLKNVGYSWFDRQSDKLVTPDV